MDLLIISMDLLGEFVLLDPETLSSESRGPGLLDGFFPPLNTVNVKVQLLTHCLGS